MHPNRVFEQSIDIQADLQRVDQTITERDLMHRWLNPALRCEAIGAWSTAIGAECLFVIQIPFWKPTLRSRVIERRLGLVVWEFDGFFQGCDRWECQPEADRIRLTNRFEFTIPSPIIATGFNIFAAHWTRRDMQSQLIRLKAVAESVGPTP
ncbi:MAG TPA: SRPBCC family protein [Stenomitos sp.]